MWRTTDNGQIKKYFGHHDEAFFDAIVDKIHLKGILSVFCLQEGCRNCENLMVMIENIRQEMIRIPGNVVIAWGVKRYNDKPVIKKKKNVVSLEKETYLPSQDFDWEKLPSHGFVIAQSSMDYLIFDDEHTPKIFATYVKNIYRRLRHGLLTSNNTGIIKKLARNQTNAIVIEYPQDFDPQQLLQMENAFIQIKKKYNYVPYLVEGTSSNIHVLKNGDNALTYEGLEVKKFLPHFKKMI